MFKTKKIYYFLLSLFFVIIPGIVFATQKLNIAWPDSPAGRPFVPKIYPIPLHHIVAYFYEWGIALGGLAAFIALLMAGAKYLTSAGVPQKMKDARDGITRALFGLGLLLSSFIILEAINPHLVHLEEPVLRLDKIGLGAQIHKKEILLHPCERITLFHYREFWDDGGKRNRQETIHLRNCRPWNPETGDWHGFCRSKASMPGKQLGSFRMERRVRDMKGNLVYERKIDEEGNLMYDEEGNPIYTDEEIWDSNCFCRLNVYDDAGCANWGWGGFVGQLSTPVVSDMEVEVRQFGKGIEMQSIGFLRFEPMHQH